MTIIKNGGSKLKKISQNKKDQVRVENTLEHGYFRLGLPNYFCTRQPSHTRLQILVHVPVRGGHLRERVVLTGEITGETQTNKRPSFLLVAVLSCAQHIQNSRPSSFICSKTNPCRAPHDLNNANLLLYSI
jgi:hypothetical protein